MNFKDRLIAFEHFELLLTKLSESFQKNSCFEVAVTQVDIPIDNVFFEIWNHSMRRFIGSAKQNQVLQTYLNHESHLAQTYLFLEDTLLICKKQGSNFRCLLKEFQSLNETLRRAEISIREKSLAVLLQKKFLEIFFVLLFVLYILSFFYANFVSDHWVSKNNSLFCLVLSCVFFVIARRGFHENSWMTKIFLSPISKKIDCLLSLFLLAKKTFVLNQSRDSLALNLWLFRKNVNHCYSSRVFIDTIFEDILMDTSEKTKNYSSALTLKLTPRLILEGDVYLKFKNLVLSACRGGAMIDDELKHFQTQILDLVKLAFEEQGVKSSLIFVVMLTTLVLPCIVLSLLGVLLCFY